MELFKYQKRNTKYMQTKLSQSLNSMDLFGQVPVFQIFKQNKFTTKSGFVFTFALMVICVIYFVITLQEALDQINPQVIFTEKQTINSEPLTLYKHNFTFAITVTNYKYSSLKTLNTHFTMKVQNCHRFRKVDNLTQQIVSQQYCEDYDIEPCSMDNHFVTPQQKEYFKEINVANLYCINSQQWDAKPPVFQGTITGSNYSYLIVTMAACKNTTSTNNCAPQEDIDKQLKTGYYALYSSDALAQMDNPGRPFEEIITLSFTSFSITNSKQLFQYYQPTYSESDYGLIFKDIQTDGALVQHTMRETQEFYNDQFIMLHTIKLDYRSSYYLRTYQKLQSILGTVGGLFQVLYFALGILLRPFIIVMMNLEMANRLFQFSQEEELNVDNFGNGVQSVQAISPNTSRQLKSSRQLSSSQRIIRDRLSHNVDSDQYIQQYLIKKKQSLYLSVRQYIIILCGCRNAQKQQLNYATNKISSKLDIVFLLNKLFEIDKLKQVLLTTNQQKLFNCLPKPIIPQAMFENDNQAKIKELEELPQYQCILEEEKSEFMKLTAAHQAFYHIKATDQTNAVDNQLLGLLDQDIIGLFQHITNKMNKQSNIILHKDADIPLVVKAYPVQDEILSIRE